MRKTHVSHDEFLLKINTNNDVLVDRASQNRRRHVSWTRIRADEDTVKTWSRQRLLFYFLLSKTSAKFRRPAVSR